MPTNGQRATQLIQSGFASQSKGDAKGAWALYLEALRCVPEHPSALQLMGQLARKRGDLPAAEDLMRRSLHTASNQPHVWNNLGLVLDALQRPLEALECFQQALALDTTNANASFNAARLLFRLKRFDLALVAVQQAALLGRPLKPELRQLQAQIEAELGQVPQALETLNSALAEHPASPPLLHNRAVLLQRLHRYPQALSDHDAAQAAGLDTADAHYNRANTLQSLGRHEEALAAYERALQRQPDHALSMFDLARLRWRMGDDKFDDQLRMAVRQQPQSAVAAGVWANLLWRAQRFADAAQAYEVCLSREPNHPAWHDGLGRCRVRLGQHAAGLAAHEAAVQLDPQRAEWRVNMAASLLQARDPQRAQLLATEALQVAPFEQYAWALLGLAWRLMGDPRELVLNDYERLVSVQELPIPTGFASLQDFHHALADELHLLHRDRAPPIDQTLRTGTQTMGNLFEQRHPLVELLQASITQQVDSFLSSLPKEPQHPFLSRLGIGWRFTDSWSSRLRQGGYHTNHVHPHGWLSSATYICVPQGADCPDKRRGWLQFGQPDFDLGLVDPVRRWVKPRPGLLVLFPSYLWHGTSPFDDDGWRLTVAFDVVPTQRSSKLLAPFGNQQADPPGT